MEIIRDKLICYVAGGGIRDDAMVLAGLRSPCEKVPGNGANSTASQDESVHSTCKSQQRMAETQWEVVITNTGRMINSS